ncbi:MAG: hypothetical protein WCS89_00740 [Candidatus Paceibacterota bacterium]|jgi:hypothetical protein
MKNTNNVSVLLKQIRVVEGYVDYFGSYKGDLADGYIVIAVANTEAGDLADKQVSSFNEVCGPCKIEDIDGYPSFAMELVNQKALISDEVVAGIEFVEGTWKIIAWCFKKDWDRVSNEIRNKSQSMRKAIESHNAAVSHPTNGNGNGKHPQSNQQPRPLVMPKKHKEERPPKLSSFASLDRQLFPESTVNSSGN